MTSLNFATV